MTNLHLQALAVLLTEAGMDRYGLHDVRQIQHALQAAWLAERDGRQSALITAALLHDIGHMVHGLGENPANQEIDVRHEEVGHQYLSRLFGPEVTEPVRLHVAAKRYLCAAEANYYRRLSPDSVRSLSLQGGPLSTVEIGAFLDNPHAQAAIQLRRYDEAAKIKDMVTPPIRHFLPHVAQCLRP